MNAPRFDLGQVVATPAALGHFHSQTDINQLLDRHRSGDWGEVCDEDKQANEDALRDGTRLLSAYRASDGTKVWVITEAADQNGKRSATTILLPDDY